MKNYFKGTVQQYIKLMIGLVVGSFLFVSCVDNKMENSSPEWLGSSLYDYMKTDGHFTNYSKLVEDLGYTEVLSKTGSKTLFVTNDSAFNEFYKNNVWGVKSYDQLTLSQKKLILNFGMIDNALLVETMSNFYDGTLEEGAAMRRETAVSVLDSLTFDNGSKLPDSQYWQYYKTKGIHILRDNTPWTTVYFTQKQLDQAQITNEDFNIISGFSRSSNDAHVFGVKIIKRDITCKNGYLNMLQSVLIPPVNMAEHVSTNPKMTIFSKLMERFSAPYYDAGNTVLYRQLHPEFNDSIFVKRYFAKLGGKLSYPSGASIATDLLLPFDPGWNSYVRSGYSLESDMGTMFVPNDNAMNTFFNSGAGAVLKDRFGSWDNIPTEILPLFLKRHIRSSFIESVPSRFSKMVDEDNSVLPVTKSDIEKTYMGSNGLVYETNKVYPPDDYNSVYGPVLLSANNASPVNKTKIWKWAIVQNDFRLYLNSLVSKYSFFVPTDEYFTKYIDPIAIGKDVPAALKYWYNDKTSDVSATIYKFNKLTGQVSDSIGVITTSTPITTAFLKNRLLDLLNMHIVVGGVETGRGYYLTKGNVALKVTGSGTSMTIEGGENISLGEKANVNKVYNQSNGYTYFIDKPIQAPLSSVYSVLSQTPEFSAFFTLLAGFPATSSSVIFVNKANYYGIDFNIKFFNTFNYTVYVPTNDAINKAITDGLISPWDTQGAIIGINQMTDATEKANAILNLERFIRYHFQDNSVFIDSQPANYTYQSATIKSDDVATHFGTFKNKYYKIGITSNGGDLTLTTESNNTANVVTSNGLYNIMTRDYVFNGKLSSFKNPDGTGSGTEFSSSLITTSSTAVIHQIDKVLTFK